MGFFILEECLNIPRILVAGTHSGAGKTTVTLGLLDGLRRRGLAVQPFKAGPDFIDTGLHSLAAGRVSRNLDSFLLKEPALREVFQRAARNADAAVIEGVMGLFDGSSGGDGRGSSAEIARFFRCPVMLVLDVSAAARSAAAAAEGFRRFDPRIKIAGVFLNGVAGSGHLRMLRQALASLRPPLPVLGWLGRDPQLRREERHLGLVPAAERALPARWLRALRRQMDPQTDWKRLLGAARRALPLSEVQERIFRPRTKRRSARIAVARDAAFCFYYQDNLDLLAAQGAEIVPFSPLTDRRLPEGTSGVYLGGGYPELHARALAENRSMREAVRRAARRGMPVYGECGGLMYLARSLTDLAGRRHPMSGALPLETFMEERLKLAYVRAAALRTTWFAKAGDRFPGHIFHFSALRRRTPRALYRLRGSLRSETDGYARHGAVAGYLHVHFAAMPGLAGRFAAAAGAYGLREAA